MELSIFVAKIIALIYVSVGVLALRGKINFSRVIDDFQQSHALTLITGMIAIIIGMLLVENHNFWVKDWTVLVTIVGWAALLKGVMYIAFPEMLVSFKPWFKNMKGWGFIMLAIGLLFGYFGFFI